MNTPYNMRFAMLLTVLGLSACASMPEQLVSTPRVELSNVQVIGLGFNSQTFLLSFEVENPNAFPLPVRHVGYGVRLDGKRFATGETPSEFTIPAQGDTRFAISVDLNLLQSSPQLLAIVRDGVRHNISYELHGELGVDIPLAPSIKYRNSGLIQLQAAAH